MPENSSHFDESGAARMVDIAEKPETLRQATASAVVVMAGSTGVMIREGKSSKGDVLQVARLGGIAGAKQASCLIPLCHPVRLTSVEIAFTFLSETRLGISATAAAVDRTGVEMEALAAATAAALTVYDMCKSVDRGMEIESVRLEAKSGGRSGDYRRKS